MLLASNASYSASKSGGVNSPTNRHVCGRSTLLYGTQFTMPSGVARHARPSADAVVNSTSAQVLSPESVVYSTSFPCFVRFKPGTLLCHGRCAPETSGDADQAR